MKISAPNSQRAMLCINLGFGRTAIFNFYAPRDADTRLREEGFRWNSFHIQKGDKNRFGKSWQIRSRNYVGAFVGKPTRFPTLYRAKKTAL